MLRFFITSTDQLYFLPIVLKMIHSFSIQLLVISLERNPETNQMTNNNQLNGNKPGLFVIFSNYFFPCFDSYISVFSPPHEFSGSLSMSIPDVIHFSFRRSQLKTRKKKICRNNTCSAAGNRHTRFPV